MIFIDTVHFGNCTTKEYINGVLRRLQEKGAKVIDIRPVLHDIKNEYGSYTTLLIVYEADAEIVRD